MKSQYPNRPISYYLEFHTPELKAKYETSNGGKGSKSQLKLSKNCILMEKFPLKGTVWMFWNTSTIGPALDLHWVCLDSSCWV